MSEPKVLVAVTVNEYEPRVVGVPAYCPVVESARPGGSAPAVTVHIMSPPLAVKDVERATPRAAVGNGEAGPEMRGTLSLSLQPVMNIKAAQIRTAAEPTFNCLMGDPFG